jgi:hypothetical protein
MVMEEINKVLEACSLSQFTTTLAGAAFITSDTTLVSIRIT